MRRIAIIGATEFQLPLIKKAKDLGYETFVYAWKSGDVGETAADVFVPISVIEKEKIYEDCLARGIDMAVSIGSDITILTVNYLMRKFNKPCNSEQCDEVSTNKYKMRKALIEGGVSCPKFKSFDSVPDESEIGEMSYPLIVKPTDRSGSRGIYKVNDYSELKEAIPLSIVNSFEKKVIVEEFIDGPEYSCECISYNGEHKALTLTKKHTTGSPNYIETGHDEPSDVKEEFIEQIYEQIYLALDALNIRYGASHAELKINGNRASIIEIGPRMGGDCIGSTLVPLSTGYDFMKMVIDIADGKRPDFTVNDHFRKAHIRFIMKQDDIDTMDKIRNDERYQFIECHLENNDIDDAVTNSTDRHGYYIYVEK